MAISTYWMFPIDYSLFPIRFITHICITHLHPLSDLVIIGIHYSLMKDILEWKLLSSSLKMEIFQFYKECIQKHLYYKQFVLRDQGIINQGARNWRYLSKNPAFTLRIHTLYQIFPDCRVVCMVREPSHSIPSMVSYITKVSILMERVYVMYYCMLYKIYMDYVILGMEAHLFSHI